MVHGIVVSTLSDIIGQLTQAIFGGGVFDWVGDPGGGGSDFDEGDGV